MDARKLTALRYIQLKIALVVRVGRPSRCHLDYRHHAAIFVRQNVAMDHIGARVIDEAAAHLEIARHLDLRFGCGVQKHVAVGIFRCGS